MRLGTLGFALLIATGCGARTGLDEGRAPGDASVDGGDAGFFVTFPCRWSIGARLELGRADSFGELSGAVHPVRRIAALSGSTSPSTHVGALVLLQHSAELLRSIDGFPGALFAGENGWLRQLEGACAVVEHDEDWVEAPELRWDDVGRCDLSQSAVGRVESVPLDDAPRLARSVRYTGSIVEELLAIDAPVRRGALVRDLDRGFVAALEVGGALSIVRVLRSGEPEVLEMGAATDVSVAPDRLRSGGLVLFRWADGWRLVRVAFEGRLEARDVTDLDSLAAPPIGALASNETEALLPLADGSMAYVPLSRGEIRSTERVEPARPPEQMQIVMRPGESAGGLLYTYRPPSGEAVLAFRALVCNR